MVPFILASLVILLILLAAPFVAARVGRSAILNPVDDETRSRGWFLRDPFFWTGALFIAYLIVQWLNSGRLLALDRQTFRWVFLPPPHPGWPSAIDRVDAVQMVAWFFPPWVAGLTLRSPWVTARGVMRFLLFLAYQAGLLALFGLVQYVSGTHSIYWLYPLDCVFFASFGYPNFAAAYFVLMGALAAGLLYREVFRRDRAAPRIRLALLVGSLVLCLIGANLSLSRAGVILAWAFALVVVAYGLFRGWRTLPPAGRLTLGVASLAAACVFYFAVSGFGGRAIQDEFQSRTPIHHILLPVLDEVNLGLAGRPMLWQIAWQVWREEPWFGWGGWGYRYRMTSHLPPTESHISEGWANVHCDLLQFLVEFGVIGFALMAAAVGCLVWSLFRIGRKAGAVWAMSSIGLCLVVVFSMIDLPFRCPAITLTWVAILAALPRVTGTQKNPKELPSREGAGMDSEYEKLRRI